jgi:solute carrier family 25 phosphate transporter 23/24/25/41
MAELGQGKSASAYEIARNMYRQGGFQSFYRGLGISILGIVPYAGIDLSIYDKLKKIYIKHSNNNPSALTHMMCGAVSGGVAASIVYPLGLLRTRLQGTDVYNLAQGTSTHPYLYPGGVRDVISETFKKEGIQGFYRGLVPSLAKVIPSVSITYICYEEAKKQLNII